MNRLLPAYCQRHPGHLRWMRREISVARECFVALLSASFTPCRGFRLTGSSKLISGRSASISRRQRNGVEERKRWACLQAQFIVLLPDPTMTLRVTTLSEFGPFK